MTDTWLSEEDKKRFYKEELNPNPHIHEFKLWKPRQWKCDCGLVKTTDEVRKVVLKGK